MKSYPTTALYQSMTSTTHTIFGPDFAGLKGKIVCMNPGCVDESFVAIPLDLLSLNNYVALMRDVIFVNQIIVNKYWIDNHGVYAIL